MQEAGGTLTAALSGIALLEALFSIQSETWRTARMARFVRGQARLAGARVWIEDGSVYAAKGNAGIFPCVVAHTDTVHAILPDAQYGVVNWNGVWHAENPLTREWVGIGGDDKVGIWIALTALQRLPAVKAVFFRDEEHGLLGARSADLGFFADVGYLIEADRRGSRDFVRTATSRTHPGIPVELHGDEFADAAAPVVARHRYGECHTGSGTDVYALVARGVGIAACNVACGYHDAHSSREHVVQHEAEQARDLVLELCGKLGHRRFAFTPRLPG